MAEHTRRPEAGPEPGAAYERRDTRTGVIFKMGAGLFMLLVVVLAAMWGLLKLFEHNPPEVMTQRSAMAEEHVMPPAPRLQANPRLDMAQFLLWEDSVLTTYGWVDHGAGLVRIPMDSAIVMVVRRGLPLDEEAVREVSGGPGAAPGAAEPGRGGSGQISGTTR